MKSTGSIVTYLILEFFIPACYNYTYSVCIVHTVYENALLFSWILRGLIESGAPAKYNYEALPRGGGSLGASGARGSGLQLSSAGTGYSLLWDFRAMSNWVSLADT